MITAVSPMVATLSEPGGSTQGVLRWVEGEEHQDDHPHVEVRGHCAGHHADDHQGMAPPSPAALNTGELTGTKPLVSGCRRRPAGTVRTPPGDRAARPSPAQRDSSALGSVGPRTTLTTANAPTVLNPYAAR